jgi:high-affinity iron transporter
VATAAALGWVVFRGGQRISLPRFFAVTTVLIVLLAAGLVTGGVGRLQGLGVLPLARPLWDTSSILSDGGAVGGFLSGLVGYRARPSIYEVAAYGGYLLLAGFLIFGAPAAETATAPATAPSRR